METQPPQDTSALEKKVADLQTDLSEVKRLLQKIARDIDDKFSLTNQANYSYYSEARLDNQEKNVGGGSSIFTSKPRPADKPDEIPYIEEGDHASCIRCGHTWIPFVRQPKKCPVCRQIWYKPKAWTRTKNLIP